jgi:glyoxylase-like metal-dependent hydrolase (beta-lactamase superfamily II)
MTRTSHFSIRRFPQGVSRILENHICESWRCNIWHIQGRDRDLIVDTGMGLWPIVDHIAALRERPVIAFCTHSHHDHAGGLYQFDKRLGHSAEAKIFAEPTRQNTVTDLLDPAVIKTAPYREFDGTIWCYPPAPLTRLVAEGDVIDLGDREFQTLHLPGHSPGSVGLWEAESGLLFTGDALYDGTLYDHLYHSVPEKLCDSLRRLRELPVSTVHAGHYKSFDKFRMLTVIDEYLSGQRSMLCPRSRTL